MLNGPAIRFKIFRELYELVSDTKKKIHDFIQSRNDLVSSCSFFAEIEQGILNVSLVFIYVTPQTKHVLNIRYPTRTSSPKYE